MNISKPYISVVSPVYKAEKVLEELVSRIETSVSKITGDFEIVLVDDRSLMGLWKITKVKGSGLI